MSGDTPIVGMQVQTFDWNAIVVGAWNLAILTPHGVASRLFGLPPGTPIEVQVALDNPAPLRVVHSGITVTPAVGLLQVQPDAHTVDGIVAASAIAARAIEKLPETPVSAAGVNFRFRFDALPDVLTDALRSALDDRLALTDQHVQSRTLRRALAWKQGSLRIEVVEEEAASGTLLVNFHRANATGAELIAWFQEAKLMFEHTMTLLNQTLGVNFPVED